MIYPKIQHTLNSEARYVDPTESAVRNCISAILDLANAHDRQSMEIDRMKETIRAQQELIQQLQMKLNTTQSH